MTLFGMLVCALAIILGFCFLILGILSLVSNIVPAIGIALCLFGIAMIIEFGKLLAMQNQEKK